MRRIEARPTGMAWRAAAVLLSAALGLSGAAWGQQVPAPAPAPTTAQEQRRQQELRRLETDLQTTRARQEKIERERAELQAEIDSLRSQMVLASRSTRENEAALTALEQALNDLNRDAAQRRAALAEKRAQMGSTLSAMQRLSLHPPELLAVLPQSPEQSVRGALVLRGLVLPLEQRARTLNEELQQMQAVEAEILRQRQRIEVASRSLAGERRQIETLLRRKQDLEKRLEDEERQADARAQRLAGQARDVRDLLDRMIRERIAEEARKREEEERRRAEEAQRAAAAAASAGGPSAIPSSARIGSGNQGAAAISGGTRTFPAAGRILASYGQTNDAGTAERGVTIQVREGALVVAPAAGTVLFAGPFRGYGLILIIEHPGGYHSLVAGLARIDARVGRPVAAGEPIAIAGSTTTPGQGPGTGVVYFELRRQGQPVNPQPWLAGG